MTAQLTAKMDLSQFIIMYESLKKCDTRRTVEQAYELAEAVHVGLFHCRRYQDFSVFLSAINRRNQKRRKAAKEKALAIAAQKSSIATV